MSFISTNKNFESWCDFSFYCRTQYTLQSHCTIHQNNVVLHLKPRRRFQHLLTLIHLSHWSLNHLIAYSVLFTSFSTSPSVNYKTNIRHKTRMHNFITLSFNGTLSFVLFFLKHFAYESHYFAKGFSWMKWTYKHWMYVYDIFLSKRLKNNEFCLTLPISLPSKLIAIMLT